MARITSFRFTAVKDPTLDAVFLRHAGAARFAYNQCLGAVKAGLDAKSTDASVRVPWSGFDLINYFNAWKLSEAAGRIWAVDVRGVAEPAEVGLVWRGEVCAQVFEEAAVDLGRALGAFSGSKAGKRAGRRVGFPTFKRKGRCRESFRLRNKIAKTGAASIRVGDGEPRSIALPVIGTVRVIEDTRRLRRLLRQGQDGAVRARIWFATVSAHRGRWQITLNVEAPDLHLAMRHDERDPDDHGGFVGVDRGLNAYIVAATADGVEVDRRPAPKSLARSLPRLRRAGRQASRKQPHSHNRRKANERLNRIHGRIADQRGHFVHEVTTRLVKTHDRLCLEDLAVANLVRNRRLARPIADAAWGELARQVAYKAAWYGTKVALAPRFFASSKICSACGRRNDTLTLAERTFRCESDRGGCGLVIDRDLNAAINLAAWAEAEHRSTVQAPDPEARGRVTNACGGNSAGHHSSGGETGPATPTGKKQEPSTASALAAGKDTREGRCRTPQQGCSSVFSEPELTECQAMSGR
jgi:putative transposase